MPFSFWKSQGSGGGGGGSLFGSPIAGLTSTCLDGSVDVMAQPTTTRLVIGGTFGFAGPCTGQGVPVSTTTGDTATGWNLSANMVNGLVDSAVPDGAGGWYIAGNFSKVGAVARPNLARIDSSGAVDLTFVPDRYFTSSSWGIGLVAVGSGVVYVSRFGFELDPQFGTTVNPSGSSVYPASKIGLGRFDAEVSVSVPDGSGGWYVGGKFTTFEGVSTGGLVRVFADGSLDSGFLPSPDGPVTSLKLNGSSLYVGGSFLNIAGVSRGYFAELSTSNGLATALDPQLAGVPYSMELDGSGGLVLGGDVQMVGSQRQGNRIASFETNTFTSRSLDQVNGTVHVSVPDGSGGFYIGGDFTQVGNKTVEGLARIKSDGTVDNIFSPAISGTVHALHLNGGTLFVGGDFFLSVPSSSTYGIASVNSTNGTAFANPAYQSSQIIYAMAFAAPNTLYIGGTFPTLFNGSFNPRNNAASINVTSSAVNAWNPNVTGTVYSMALSSGTVFIGGSFGSIGGSVRNNIGAYTTAAALSGFNPNSNGRVLGVAVLGGTLYSAGEFTTIGGASRNYMAALNTTNGTALIAFNPNLNQKSQSVYIAPNLDLFFGGDFTTVGGTDRGFFASVNPTNGTLNSFNPNFSKTVRTISGSGTLVMMGGAFEGLGGTVRSNLLAISTSNGTLYSWNPSPNGPVNALLLNGTVLYVGGSYGTIGSQARNSLSALGLPTYSLTSWNPNPNGIVNALAYDGTDLFVGGSYGTIGGQTRSNLAAISISTGNATAWIGNTNSTVNSIAQLGSNLYVGGSFTTINSVGRNRAASLLISSGSVGTWNPNLNAIVKSISTNGTDIYVGGLYTSIGSGSSPTIAAFNSITGVSTGWTSSVGTFPHTALIVSAGTLYSAWGSGFASVSTSTGNANYSISTTGYVKALVEQSGTLFVGGGMTAVNGTPRGRFAAVNSGNGTLFALNPNFDGAVRSFAISGNTIFAGGQFTSINSGSTALSYAVEFNRSTGLPTGWAPTGVDDFIEAVEYSGSSVYIGGYFKTVNGAQKRGAAEISASNGTLNTSWSPNPLGIVTNMSLNGANIYLAGPFYGLGKYSRNNIAALDLTTLTLTDWAPQANGKVRSLLTYGSNMIAGGEFTSVGGGVKRYLALVSGSTGLAINSWGTSAVSGAPAAVKSVNAIVQSGTLLYVAGSFGTIGSTARANIAALNLATGTLNTSFANINVNNQILRMVQGGGTLYITGDFNTVAATGRSFIAAVTTAGALVAGFNPGTDSFGSYNNIALQNGTIYVTGSFGDFGAVLQSQIGVANASTGAGTYLAFDTGAGDYNSMTFNSGTLFVGGWFNDAPKASVVNYTVADRLIGPLRLESDSETFDILVNNNDLILNQDIPLRNGYRRPIEKVNSSTGQIVY